MKSSAIRIALAAWLTFLIPGCETERPWVGTYTLEMKPEDKIIYDMLREEGREWPSITFYKDGTFVLTKPEGIGRGTYAVVKGKVTITMQSLNGTLPEGSLARPHSVDFSGDYRILYLEGPSGERWLRRE